MTVHRRDSALSSEPRLVPCLVRGVCVDPPETDPANIARALDALAPGAPASAENPRRIALPGAILLDRGTYAPLLLPRVKPEHLILRDRASLAIDLCSLRTADILQFVAALRQALLETVPPELAQGRSAWIGQAVVSLFDPDGLGEAIDRELAGHAGAGRQYLDGWVHSDVTPHAGATLRNAARVFGDWTDNPSQTVRAIPCRQLHITPAGTVLSPALSLLRALASRGDAVIKTARDAALQCGWFARAVAMFGPDHPIACHLSMVYWEGGDRTIEDRILVRGAFDRIVVWGAGPTIEAVLRRGLDTRMLLMKPRMGLSLIGRDALAGDIDAVAERAVTDSVIGEQRACIAALVHCVEGTPGTVLNYCDALARALDRWDSAVPAVPDDATVGRLRMMRRLAPAGTRFFLNPDPRTPRSGVVFAPGRFDMSDHPLGRVIVVRPVADLQEALSDIGPELASVAIAPETQRIALRDTLGCLGVSTIAPLGAADRFYPGMPHDGMRVLSELVEWVNG